MLHCYFKNSILQSFSYFIVDRFFIQLRLVGFGSPSQVNLFVVGKVGFYPALVSKVLLNLPFIITLFPL